VVGVHGKHKVFKELLSFKELITLKGKQTKTSYYNKRIKEFGLNRGIDHFF
jgi:hypothetical protein